MQRQVDAPLAEEALLLAEVDGGDVDDGDDADGDLVGGRGRVGLADRTRSRSPQRRRAASKTAETATAMARRMTTPQPVVNGERWSTWTWRRYCEPLLPGPTLDERGTRLAHARTGGGSRCRTRRTPRPWPPTNGSTSGATSCPHVRGPARQPAAGRRIPRQPARRRPRRPAHLRGGRRSAHGAPHAPADRRLPGRLLQGGPADPGSRRCWPRTAARRCSARATSPSTTPPGRTRSRFDGPFRMLVLIFPRDAAVAAAGERRPGDRDRDLRPARPRRAGRLVPGAGRHGARRGRRPRPRPAGHQRARPAHHGAGRRAGGAPG